MSNKLPAVVSQIPPDLRMFLDRVRDIVRAAGRDRLITADDLAALKLANINAQGVLTPSITAPSVLPPPPAPANVSATAAIQNIIVEWDAPAYFGHAYAEVWTAGVDDLGQAVLLGVSPGALYVDSVGPSTTRYYWVRFVNTDDIKGPFNAISGATATTAPDLSYIMGVLSDTFGGTSAAPFFQINQSTVIGGVTIPAGTYMKSAFIYDGVITNAKIGNLAVDTAKIANAAITTAKIGDAQVTTAKIGDAQITNAKIGNLAVDNAKIANAAITTAKIGDAQITNAKIANASISNNLIVSGTIAADRIQANAIAVTQTASIAGTVTSVLTFGTTITFFNSNSVGGIFIQNTSNVTQQMLVTGTGRSGAQNFIGESQTFGVFDGTTRVFDYGWSPAGEDAKAFGVNVVIPANSAKTITVRAAKTSTNLTLQYTLTLSTLGVRN